MYMLRDAIVKAGSEEAADVRAALEATDGDYVTGHLTFDANHNPIKSAVMLRIQKDANGALATAYEATVDISK